MKDINIIYERSNDSTLEFGFNGFTQMVEGYDWLVQTIVKQLLTIKGSNNYSPEIGTYFTNLVGSNINTKDDLTVSQLNIVNAVSNVETYIKQLQKSNSEQVTEDQRLKSLEVTNVIHNKLESRLEVIIKVNLENGTSNILRV